MKLIQINITIGNRPNKLSAGIQFYESIQFYQQNKFQKKLLSSYSFKKIKKTIVIYFL